LSLLYFANCCIIIIFYPRQSLFSEHTRIQHVTIPNLYFTRAPLQPRLALCVRHVMSRQVVSTVQRYTQQLNSMLICHFDFLHNVSSQKTLTIRLNMIIHRRAVATGVYRYIYPKISP